MKNWKTTLSGIATILITIADIVAKIASGQPIDILTAITGVSAGVGLITAKDHNVTGGTVQQ